MEYIYEEVLPKIEPNIKAFIDFCVSQKAEVVRSDYPKESPPLTIINVKKDGFEAELTIVPTIGVVEQVAFDKASSDFIEEFFDLEILGWQNAFEEAAKVVYDIVAE